MIQRELSRLAKALNGGKNPQGRALEAMAVLSSQTPDGSLELDGGDDSPASSTKPKKKKKRDKDDKIKLSHA